MLANPLGLLHPALVGAGLSLPRGLLYRALGMSPCSLSQVLPVLGIAFSLSEMAVARAPRAAQCLQEGDAQGVRTELSQEEGNAKGVMANLSLRDLFACFPRKRRYPCLQGSEDVVGA